MSTSNRQNLEDRLIVWSFGMLLGISITSYLASRIYLIKQTIKSLDDGTAGLNQSAPGLWSQISLYAIVFFAILYLFSFVWYHLKRRKNQF